MNPHSILIHLFLTSLSFLLSLPSLLDCVLDVIVQQHTESDTIIHMSLTAKAKTAGSVATGMEMMPQLSLTLKS
jgi:hypothetical protein